MEMRDTLLEDFLRFLNTLSATHVTIRALLSSDHWFRNLLKIVCLDSNPGTSHTRNNSLKYKMVNNKQTINIYLRTLKEFPLSLHDCFLQVDLWSLH